MKLSSFRLFFIIVFSMFALFYSCEEENLGFSTKGEFQLSTDTLSFDTLITTYRSTTLSFKIINPGLSPLKLRNIRLGSGNDSYFRLNVDGEPCKSINDVEILSKDSIFVFVEATFPEFSVDSVCYRLDSVVIETENDQKNVKLLSWSQDVTFIRNYWVTTSETWSSKKPYLIVDTLAIDENQTLTIEKGTKIFFHDSAGMYVLGNVVVKGTKEEPVIFQNDRFDETVAGDNYEEMPGMWNGIFIAPSNRKSSFDHTVIKNSIVGISAGNPLDPIWPRLSITNSLIKNQSFSGLFSIGAIIECSNTIFSNSRAGIVLFYTGKYSFNHITVSNNYKEGRQAGSVFIQDYFSNDTATFIGGEFEKIFFGNSVISGNYSDEINVKRFGGNDSKINCEIEHCMVKLTTPDTLYKRINYSNLTIDNEIKFDSIYNYLPDTGSSFVDKGDLSIGQRFPFDMVGNSRTADGLPDLGAVEFIKK